MNEARKSRFLIVGTGASGISPAVLLKRKGIDDIRIISRHSDFGGVWHENRYPGCITDVPVLAYQLSWARSHDWTSNYVSQNEMAVYLRKVARDNGLDAITDFETELLEARWQDADACWKVVTNRGDYFADFLILSTGFLDQKTIPDLEGMDTFKGRIFHSAVWPEGYTGEGDRVAVLGASSSAVQIVPELQKVAKQVYVFQRTPVHIFPLNREFYTPEQIAEHRSNAEAYDEQRAKIMEIYDTVGMDRVMGKDKEALIAAEDRARQHRESQISDPVILANVTPDYGIYCKRPTQNDLYFPSLLQPNVELIAEGAKGVREHSIYAPSGREVEVDTVVMATGFRWGGDILERVRRRDGQTVAEHQKGHRRAYKSVSVAGCPNLFLVGGAGANGALWSGYLTGEIVPDYIKIVSEYMKENAIPAMEVTEEAEIAWKKKADDILSNAPTITAGCVSYCLDETGHDMTFYPGRTSAMAEEMNEFNPSDYQVVMPTLDGNGSYVAMEGAGPGKA